MIISLQLSSVFALNALVVSSKHFGLEPVKSDLVIKKGLTSLMKSILIQIRQSNLSVQ